MATIYEMEEKLRKREDLRSVQIWPQSKEQLEVVVRRLSKPGVKVTRTAVLGLLIHHAFHLTKDELVAFQAANPNAPVEASNVAQIAADVAQATGSSESKKRRSHG